MEEQLTEQKISETQAALYRDCLQDIKNRNSLLSDVTNGKPGLNTISESCLQMLNDFKAGSSPIWRAFNTRFSANPSANQYNQNLAGESGTKVSNLDDEGA